MDDMDIDLVVDIPDTPDRLAVRHINGGKYVRKESNSSISGHSRNSDFMDEERLNRANRPTGRGRVETENGHSRRHHMHPRKPPNNLEEIERRNNSIILSPLEKPYASRSSLLFRKTTIDKNSKDETGHFNGAHHMDKGKATRDADHLAKEMREGQIASNGGSSLHCAPNSSKISSNAHKGKEKIDDNTCKRAGSVADNGRGIDLSCGSQHKMEKEMSTSHHSVISPRVTGQKRLVRNGCISPHNIATRLAERRQNSIKARDVDQNQITNVVPGGPCLIDISEIVAEDNYCDRVKGKGVLTHPCTSKEHDAKIIHLSSSTPRSNNEEANGTGDASRDAVGCFEGLGGWRSTRNRSRKIDYPFSDDAGRSSGMNDEVGCFVNQQHRNRDVKRDNGSERKYRDGCDYQEDWDAAQAASRPVSELDQFSEPRLTTNTIAKRQKNGLASRNHGDISGMVSDDSEVVVLGSSGVSSSSSSSRIQNCQRQGILGPILEIDELSPEIRCSESRGFGSMNNDESGVRARQVEADEMLARELQEQLYHEAPIFGGGEIDENIAWSLQQEDALGAASSRNQHVSHPRSLSRTHSYRHPMPRSLQNPSNRRGSQARVPTARMSRLRSRIFSRSPAASSRAGNFQFPMEMGLDMRLDILEALEAAVGDFSDTGPTSHIHQLQRDFNENDYEMLLALDENNHRHVGASVNQINSLPQSTVQTENFDEACAICLETPTIGETIRHLPCLHKFHKDCIDPWLSRKTSCPVCKSSIA